MQFQALPVSTHPLVLLRPIAASDLGDWLDYLTLPVVYEHTSWATTSTTELAPYVWSAEIAAPSAALRLAIADRASGRLVGTMGFHTVSAQNRSAELAYDLAPQVWGKGIATQLCNTLVAWAHSDAGLLRVQATTLESNLRSARVLQRCGFVHEGLLRSYRMVRGTPGNFNLFAHVHPMPADPDTQRPGQVPSPAL